MFKSELSGKQYPAGERPVKIVTAKRIKLYKDEKGATVSRGWEIVKEMSVGQDEIDKVTVETAEEVKPARVVIDPTNRFSIKKDFAAR